MHPRQFVSFLFALVLLPSVAVGQEVRHPLDPLTWQEHWTVIEVLRAADRMDENTRFSFVGLHEPDKELVSRWTVGEGVPRAAFAVVRDGPRTYEAVIDLVGQRVAEWREITGIQPQWLEEEYGVGVAQVKEHPDFLAAMERRGITDLSFIDRDAQFHVRGNSS